MLSLLDDVFKQTKASALLEYAISPSNAQRGWTKLWPKETWGYCGNKPPTAFEPVQQNKVHDDFHVRGLFLTLQSSWPSVSHIVHVALLKNARLVFRVVDVADWKVLQFINIGSLGFSEHPKLHVHGEVVSSAHHAPRHTQINTLSTEAFRKGADVSRGQVI